MAGFTLQLYLVIAFFIQNLSFLVLFLFPWGISWYLIYRKKGSNRYEAGLASISIILVIVGVLILLFGAGLSSPEFRNPTQNSTTTINMQLNLGCDNTSSFYSNKNASILNNIKSPLRLNESKINATSKDVSRNSSEYNATATITQDLRQNPLEMVGLVLGIVGLGLSIISVGMNNLFSIGSRKETHITKNCLYQDLFSFSRRYTKILECWDYIIIGFVWILFGAIPCIYGVFSSIYGLDIINFFGLLYISFGIILAGYGICVGPPKNFAKIVRKSRADLGYVPSGKISFISRWIGEGIISLGIIFVILGFRILKIDKIAAGNIVGHIKKRSEYL